MLMDEPFGALDPITRDRLQLEFLRLHEEVRKTVIFVTHDIDEAIKLGDRIAILREGGHLAQYDTPDRILAHPADDFVARFVGADRGLKRLALRRPRRDRARAARRRTRRRAAAPGSTTLRDALSLMMSEGADPLVVVDRRRARRSACSRSPASAACSPSCDRVHAPRAGPGDPGLRRRARSARRRTTPSAGAGCRTTGATRSSPRSSST